MSSYSPLQIAGKVVHSVFGAEVDLPEDGNYFSFYFDDIENVTPQLELICIDRKRFLVLDFAVAIYFDLAPLKGCDKVSDLLDKSVTPFLDGISDGEGKIVLHQDGDGSIIPTFESSIDYAPLENNELSMTFRQNLIRGARALKLLSPIFKCLEHQHLPKIDERMRMLYREHCRWEFNGISTDVPKHAVRLPPGLFGGVTAFIPQ